ncbi:MAG: DUF4127 family protein [Bacillota bacterium]
MRRWWAALVMVALLGVQGPVRAGGHGEEWRVLWIPLDSRPVNTGEVQLFGAAAGARLLLPPATLLDWHATRRADTDGLLRWWQQTARPGDTVVFATNSLLAGGLIATRDPAHYTGLEKRLATLEEALAESDQVRRIAVHVLPRAWPTQFRPDGSAAADPALTGLLLERTELQHRVRLFGRPADEERLAALDRAIPAAERGRQDALIEQNRQVLAALLDWAEAGLVNELVIGLDDARPYGMANLLHREAAQVVAERGLSDRVHAHYGADEIGFLLVAREALRRAGLQPRIAVEYGKAGSEGAVLPYEGASLGRSVGQKLTLLGAVPAGPGAGQRLFVHTARDGAASRRLLERMAAAYGRGESVALADVTSTGGRDRALVERLSESVPLTGVAYAGWNTASNAVGTALALAAVRELQSLAGASEHQVLALEAFQAVRYAHDLVFQERREEMAAWARRHGIDPDRFGPGRRAMARHLQGSVLPEAQAWLDRFHRGPVGVAGAAFPWERTFDLSFRPLVRAAGGATGR